MTNSELKQSLSPLSSDVNIPYNTAYSDDGVGNKLNTQLNVKQGSCYKDEMLKLENSYARK